MNFRYINQILIHITFGILLYYIDIFSNVYFFGVVLFFLVKLITVANKDKIVFVLMACAYICGAETIFRMTGGGIFYESSKYFVIFFMLLGFFYNGISNKGYPYFIYLIFLVPAIVVAASNISFDANLRKNVAFVLSGPVCLGISALYCYDKKLSQKQLLDILFYLGLPIITQATYLFVYSPNIKDILSGTQSNFEASGGFGPNQVATILGLGMFVFGVFFFLRSKTIELKFLNIILFGLISYRAVITFSRGGVITAVLMIIAFLVLVYSKASRQNKNAIVGAVISFIIALVLLWGITSNQTEGLIDNRYTNKDALGREKEDMSTGRVDLFVSELEGFLNHPFLGVGTSGMKEERLKTEGRIIATHNEVSRLLSEHGILGVFMLIILIFKSLLFRSTNQNNYFFYSFLIFWFATINHSAMRIAAPGFIYALALLNIQNEKRPIHRKRLIK